MILTDPDSSSQFVVKCQVIGGGGVLGRVGKNGERERKDENFFQVLEKLT